MGKQHQSILAYGVIIPQDDLYIFLQALRKLAQSPNAEEPIERWDYDHYDEIENHLENLLKADNIEFRFYALGSPERGWKGQAILYGGGSEVDVWGSDPTVEMEYLPEFWNEHELIEAANQAFKKIAELPGINETQIDVEPSWVQGLSLE